MIILAVILKARNSPNVPWWVNGKTNLSPRTHHTGRRLENITVSDNSSPRRLCGTPGCPVWEVATQQNESSSPGAACEGQTGRTVWYGSAEQKVSGDHGHLEGVLATPAYTSPTFTQVNKSSVVHCIWSRSTIQLVRNHSVWVDPPMRTLTEEMEERDGISFPATHVCLLMSLQITTLATAVTLTDFIKNNSESL